MGEFAGLSSNLSGRYERQQRLGMRATQAKNQRLNHKFGIAISCIDNQEKKEMKQWEKTRKDMVKLLKKINVSSGCSVKEEEVQGHRKKMKPRDKYTRIETDEKESFDDNFTEIIDQVVDYNHYQGEHSERQRKLTTDLVIPSSDSKRFFDLVSESQIPHMTEGLPSTSKVRIFPGRREMYTFQSKEQLHEFNEGGRIREWVESQNSELIDIGDFTSRLRGSKLTRSHTFPLNQKSKYHENSVEITQQGNDHHKKEKRPHIVSQQRNNPRDETITSSQTEKKIPSKADVRFRMIEANRRKGILAKANEVLQDEDDGCIVLKDEKWAEHVNNLRERVEQKVLHDSHEIATYKSIKNNSEAALTVSDESQVMNRRESGLTLSRRKLVRRTSLPVLAVHSQRQ